jgi:hypothetical protein
MARRLARLFPGARILLTIRQPDYVVSKFNMLRTNARNLAGVALNDFHLWLARELGQYRSLHLMNVNYFEVFEVFEGVFGAENIIVCPLEYLTTGGHRAFAARLAAFLEINPQEITSDLFAARINSSEQAFAGFGEVPISAALTLTDAERTAIGHRCADGNAQLAERSGLDLRCLGYPMPDG